MGPTLLLVTLTATLPCQEPDGAFPFLYTSPVQSQVYQTGEFCRLTAVCLSVSLSVCISL